MNELRESVKVGGGENLNKENFWDISMRVCPLATRQFCEWVDKYKQVPFQVPEYNRPMVWDTFFANNTPTEQKIKFHHVPLEMQIGIIFKFFHDECRSGFKNPVMNWVNPLDWIDAVCDMLVYWESVLNSHAKKDTGVSAETESAPGMIRISDYLLSIPAFFTDVKMKKLMMAANAEQDQHFSGVKTVDGKIYGHADGPVIEWAQFIQMVVREDSVK